ncbi:phage tail protein [Enterobacter hormaechei]|uniref:phage tail protein n=1 Tax=Enterobacter hormaechei TaxID=158836 RepID=UPI0015E96E86|nr:phage tail protein [Enterobacter hormaechei]QLU86033.1 tail fiber protein [Enterobacter hormaechei]
MCNCFSKNLGLGEGSALPVGVPIPWPSATPPTGWLKCNGAAFTASQYPKLALAYPALRLPDLRGEFIRGWDDGRGIDSGRSLLSAQGDAIRNITGGMDDIYCGASARADSNTAFAKTIVQDTTVYWVTNGATHANRRVTRLVMDASSMVPTASENRPRNVAFNYIVRAA